MATGKKGEKDLHLGARLKYPIKITKLYKRPGDMIKRQEPVLQYSFEYTMELPQDRETLALQTKTLTSITDWDAPEEGKLLAWNVRVGDIVTGDRVCVTVEEACTHEIQYQGLCALCGKDMSEVNWANEERDTDRAPINMTHDQTSLTVSRVAAMRAENDLQQRLLNQRKLSLVVDLDQTIIHACIDPTIGEWQMDPANPNHDALRDVQRFQLEEGHNGVARGCYYYIKMRPGLADFLATIATMYELHVYTMGTRTYATNIAKIVDPDQRLFGNRVISRDENGNIVSKSLQRIFPVSTNMAVIIDDRADVWPKNRHNLIKVSPYDFFKGTGDINSSFLPKRHDLHVSTSTSELTAPVDSASSEAPDTPPVSTEVTMEDNNVAASPASTVASSVPVNSASTEPTASSASTPTTNGSSGNVGAAAPNSPRALTGLGEIDMVLLQKQTEEQERTIEKQIKDRPLLHMQEELDKKDEAASAAAAASTDDAQDAPGVTTDEPSPESSLSTTSRHCVLFDDDTELRYLQQHLTQLHHEFYEQYDARLEASASQLKSNRRSGLNKDEAAMAAVPDVGKILDGLKERVLKNTVIVLTGLVPLGVDVRHSEIGIQALSFGTSLERNISRKVTHLVTSSDRPRTSKVQEAACIPTIKIVNQNWLIDCFTQWAHVDETPYLVAIHPADRGRADLADTNVDSTDTDTVSHADTESDVDENSGRTVAGDEEEEKARLRLRTPDDERDDLEDFDESKSPIPELGTFDWGSADDELAMFLAEGDDDEDENENNVDGLGDMDDGGETDDANMDSEAEASENGDGDNINGGSVLSTSSKRKYASGSRGSGAAGGGDTDTESERGTSIRGRSLLVKRQKLAASRSRSTSRLRAAAATGNGLGDGGSHPLRQQTLSRDLKTAPATTDAASDVTVGPTAGGVDIDEDELEAMLMAELDEEEAAAAGADG